jgi:hypothetical protein
MADAVTPQHGRRFGLAYLALAAVLGAGIGTFVLLVERGPPPPPPPWSSWRPSTGTALQRAKEIASHVSPQYRLASGKQLVRVYIGNPGTSRKPISLLAVADKANPTSAEDFDTFAGSTTVMYILCGNGPKCSINVGKPTVARGAVLRREALELALYTFRYVSGIDSVVAFFPPRKGEQPTYALFFRKDELDKQLDRPLRKTLPQVVPPIPGKLPVTAVEKKVIDELTTARVFRYQVEESQGQRVLVLAPVV